MATCTGFIKPLNLECSLVNIFSGSPAIFFAIFGLFVGGLAAKFRMPWSITLGSVALFGIMFGEIFAGELYLIILLISIIVSFGIGKVVTR